MLLLTPQVTGADGISTMAREVVAALRKEIGGSIAGLQVWSLADAAAPEDMEDSGVTFRTAQGSRTAFAAFGLREGEVDRNTVVLVLHAHLLPVALPLALRGARLVAMLLGIEAWKPFTRLQRAALARAWRVAAISQHTIIRFRAANPDLSEIPVRVLYPGPPNGHVNGSGHSGGMYRSGERDGFALIVGRMSSAERYKGHDELLECWTTVRAMHPAARLVIAGGGDDHPRLRAKARQLGLDGCVRFEGVADAARLDELYRRAAFFVMPSRAEGFGLVYLEAMRSGLPCVGAPGAAEEIIEDNVTGFIVDPCQPGALADAIVRLFDDGAAREAMGRAAARRVESRFGGFQRRLLDLLTC